MFKNMLKTISLLLLLFIHSPLSAQFSLGESSSIPEPDLEIQLDKQNYHPGEKGVITVIYRLPNGYHQIRDDFNFKLEMAVQQGFISGSTIYPEGETVNGITNYYDQVQLQIEFFPSENIQPGFYNLEIQAKYQLCDENGTCYFPSSLPLSIDLEISGNTVGSHSLIYYLLLALVGGFLLNLMPCVLPLLSVKALNLINQGQGNRKSILINALSYTSGILASFLILSGIIISLQQSGRLLGWGFQFQNPYFLIVLISIIFLFSLSLFEVFVLLPPSSGLNKAVTLSSKKGYAGSFFTGIFAVFVATPCTAPFLGAAMGFAFSQPAGVILSIMLLTGLGLSLPFLILGLFPSFFTHLPKPGKWMDKLREVMAFLLMGTVVYLSTTLLKQIGNRFPAFLWFLLILAVSAWIWGWMMTSVRKRGIRIFILLISLGALLMGGKQLLSDLDRDQNGISKEILQEGWNSFSPERIEEDINNNRTVFLAFSANWCTTCKLNEKTVLYTDGVKNLFMDKGVKLYKGDLTSSNPEAMEWIYSFGRAGVPLYVLYKPGEDPRILPEILSYSILEKALK